MYMLMHTRIQKDFHQDENRYCSQPEPMEGEYMSVQRDDLFQNAYVQARFRRAT